MHCVFGSGWVLGGHHPDILNPPVNFSQECSEIRSATTSRPLQTNHVSSCLNLFPDSFDIPLQPPRKCNRCKNCQACRFENEEATKQEQEELAMIWKNTFLDPEKKRCFTSFPIIKETDTLFYNEAQVTAIAKSLKKSLEKNNQLEAYNAEVQDYLDREVLVPVERKEIAEWQDKGYPVCLISHHAVCRPDKATTKVRCE